MKNKMRYLGILILAVLTAVFSRPDSWAQYDENKKADTKEKSSPENSPANNKICPVDFKSIYQARKEKPQEEFQYAYKGKIYNFDSASCVKEFKKDPEKYLKEWEKKERFRRINIIDD